MWLNLRKITFRKLAVCAMILSLMVTVTGTLSYFAPGGTGKDLRVDLNDLILHTQRMADTANHPETFSKSFNDVVRSFRLVSGIDHHISNQKPKGFFNFSSLNMHFVPNVVSFHEQDDRYVLQIPALDYLSLMTAPPDPPPEKI
jgi:hypothetical protein